MVVRIDSKPASSKKNQQPYPNPIGDAAYYGVAGEFVRLVADHTEADPNVLLMLFLTYAGNMMGRHAYLSAAEETHYGNINVCAVGPTSGGRKGTAFGPVTRLFERVDERWANTVVSGLSSGEGLIWAVRDPIAGKKDKKGATDDDPGISDKRLLVRESEFFSTLQAMRRTGSTLSSTIRNAFDWGNLRILTKNSPAKATGAHISIVGNITKEELLRGIVAEEADNGFSNRFLWVCSRRSKELPEGGQLRRVIESREFADLTHRVRQHAGDIYGPLTLDQDAQDIWGRNGTNSGLYHELSKDRPANLFTDATTRSHTFVMRLSLIYALLDGAREIRREHQDAAAECWRYCEDSALFIFGDGLVDPAENKILDALIGKAEGLSRTEIKRDVLSGHKTAAQLTDLLNSIATKNLAYCEVSAGDMGRPAERWFAGQKLKEPDDQT